MERQNSFKADAGRKRPVLRKEVIYECLSNWKSGEITLCSADRK